MNAYRKLHELQRTAGFVAFEKEFANAIAAGLSASYGGREEKLVERLCGEISGLPQTRNVNGVTIANNAVFLHGGKSQVKFQYYDESARCELCDLLYIITVVYKGEIVLQKLTLSQFKKASSGSWKWDIRNKSGNKPRKTQLYLLSRFPEFETVSRASLGSGKYSLPNHTGCLGSYCLLHAPGDFVFIAATSLAEIVGPRDNVCATDFVALGRNGDAISRLRGPCALCCPAESLCGPDCYFEDFPRGRLFKKSTYPYATNVYDFSHKYLRLGIGEPVYALSTNYNEQLFNWWQNFLAATEQSNKKGVGAKKFIEDMPRKYLNRASNESRRHNDANLGYAGMGVIYTVVNLGAE